MSRAFRVLLLAMAAAAANADLDRGRALYDAALARNASKAHRVHIVDKLAPQSSLPPGKLTVGDVSWVERHMYKAGNLVPVTSFEALIPAGRAEDFLKGEAERGTGASFSISNSKPATGYALHSCRCAGKSHSAKANATAASATPPGGAEILALPPPPSAPAVPPAVGCAAPAPTRGAGVVASSKVGCPVRFSTKPSPDHEGFTLVSYLNMDHVEGCCAQGTPYLSPAVRAWCRKELLACPDLAPHVLVERNATRIAQDYADGQGWPVKQAEHFFNEARYLPHLRVLAAACVHSRFPVTFLGRRTPAWRRGTTG
jgi:hypothetical protein